MAAHEGPHYRIQDTVSVYSYGSAEAASESISHAESHFQQAFNVKRFREGYILVSTREILDARGFVVSDDSPLERGIEAFHEIINGSVNVSP